VVSPPGGAENESKQPLPSRAYCRLKREKREGGERENGSGSHGAPDAGRRAARSTIKKTPPGGTGGKARVKKGSKGNELVSTEVKRMRKKDSGGERRKTSP